MERGGSGERSPPRFLLRGQDEVPHNLSVSASGGISGTQERKASVPLTEQRAEQLKILVSNPHLGISSPSSPCSPPASQFISHSAALQH